MLGSYILHKINIDPDTEDYDSDFPGHTLVYELGNYALRFIDHDYNDGYYLNTSVNLI